MKHVLVLGAGGWGTALAGVLAQSGHRVTLWARRPEFAAELARARENSRYLPGILIPATVKIASGPPPKADVAVAGVPTQHLRDVLESVKADVDGAAPWVSLAKGIEEKTLLRPTEIVSQVLGSARVAALSGPSHAEEVGRGLPTTVVLAAEDEALAKELQGVFSSETFRVYTTDDPRGVEYAAALKNVIAIAAGICDGLGLGDNAKAALISRGVVEMARLGAALGAKKSTFFGIAGIGDLVTTCVSRHGRNLALGRKIGAGAKLEEVLSKMTMVAEGVWTSRAALELGRRGGVETPITEAVCRVLFEGKPPMEAVRELMTRLPKSEREDLP